MGHDGERVMNCGECRMLIPAERPIWHPHIVCMLYNAGVRDPVAYLKATMPLLVEHFPSEAPDDRGE